MKTCRSLGCVGALLIVAGCGGGDADDPAGASGDAATGPGSGQGGGTGTGSATSSGGTGGSGAGDAVWQELITADWSLAPGNEKTSDIHVLTVDRDMYIGAIRPIAPEGTHHTLLALGGLDAGDVIYASGVGTNAVVFPPGVGLRVPAGETVVLQLHLFNPSGNIISGISGIEIVEVAPEDIELEADLFLPGPIDLSIPPNQQYTETSTCTVSETQKVFAIFPHMHQLGTHLKTTLEVGGVTQPLHDGAYEFNHQAFLSFDPIELVAGDSITTECTWNNTTPETITWGESSTTEMCFSILYRYPAQPGYNFCE